MSLTKKDAIKYVLILSLIITLSVLLGTSQIRYSDQDYTFCNITYYNPVFDPDAPRYLHSYNYTLSANVCNGTVINNFIVNTNDSIPPDMKYPCWLYNCKIYIYPYKYDMFLYIGGMVLCIIILMFAVVYDLKKSKRSEYGVILD